MKKIFSIFLLILTAAALGALAGGVTAGFLHLIDWGQTLLWKGNWASFQLAPLLFCTIGGILVGLSQRFLGDHPKDLQSSIREIGQTGRLDYKSLPRGSVLILVSLIFGASLGPEAAIVSLLGGLSTWAGDWVGKLRRRLDLSSTKEEKNRLRKLLRKWPYGVLLTAATVAFYLVVKSLYSSGFLKMTEAPAWNDLLWSLPLSLLGALAGSLYMWLQKKGEAQSARYHTHPMLGSTLSGLALGLAATFLPMMLFSGQHDLQTAYNQAGQMGSVQLITIALVRLVLIAFLLASGWKGGQFLPLMFASEALGLGISVAVPTISAPTAILAVMSGLLVIVLPSPVAVFILMALIFQKQYIGIIVVAVLVIYGIQTVLKRLRKVSPTSE